MEDAKIAQHLGTLFEQNKWIIQTITEVKKDVQDLKNFKWKVIGAGMATGAIFAFIFELTKDFMHK